MAGTEPMVLDKADVKEDDKAGDQEEAPCSREATADDLGCSETERFEMELEFVQCLASPEYLNWLAQNRYFEDAAFLKYLDYLRYWKRQEYCTYITYPHCLTFLDLLQDSAFRKSLARSDLMHGITWQQFHFHNHYRKNRFREAQESAVKEAAETGEANPDEAMVS